jgi:hypothetical protein
MSKSTKAPKAVAISAPKIVTAWKGVCNVSAKSETEIVKSIENFHNTLTNESRLSIADKKTVVKRLETGGVVSSFIKASHIPALPTFFAMRTKWDEFKALPLAKQLSTAMASYDLLGAGTGEQIGTLEALTKEIATVRKAKQSPKPAKSDKDTKPAKEKATVADTLRAAIALVESIQDGCEDEVYDLLLELAQAAALKVGADA